MAAIPWADALVPRCALALGHRLSENDSNYALAPVSHIIQIPKYRAGLNQNNSGLKCLRSASSRPLLLRVALLGQRLGGFLQHLEYVASVAMRDFIAFRRHLFFGHATATLPHLYLLPKEA
jgi:hypothetical protein